MCGSMAINEEIKINTSMRGCMMELEAFDKSSIQIECFFFKGNKSRDIYRCLWSGQERAHKVGLLINCPFRVDTSKI
jgi:hypothetical protein